MHHRFLWLCVLLSTVALPAAPIGPLSTSGLELFAAGGPVTLYFYGSTASYDSTISVVSPGPAQGPFFPNHSTQAGASQSIGSFAAGTPIIFRLNVLTTGDFFYTGPASQNPDGQVHAAIGIYAADATIPVNGQFVGFEDLFNGPFVYNDHQFVFAGVTTAPSVPEPSCVYLVCGALLTLGGWRRIRRT